MKVLSETFIKLVRAGHESVQFRQGQILNGRVMRFFPHDIAEVQIGNQRIIAQLNLPLTANESYWFEVQNSEGTIQLKVLTQDLNGKQDGALSGLLQQLNLPITKENQNLVQFFLKEQIPINAKTLQIATHSVQDGQSIEEGMKAIKMIFERGWPLNEAIFKAVVSVQSEEPISPLLNKLRTQLTDLQHLNEAKALSNKIDQLFNSDRSQLQKSLLHNWLQGSASDSTTAFSLLQKIGAFPTDTTETDIIVNMIKSSMKTNQLSESIGNALLDVIAKNQNSSLPSYLKALVDLERAVGESSSGKLTNVQSLLQSIRTSMTAFPVDEQRLNQFIREYMSSAGKINSININEGAALAITANDFIVKQTRLTSEEAKLFNHLHQNIMSQEINSSQLKDYLKNMMTSLGLSYEHGLADNIQHSRQESLKPLLIALLADEIPSGVKDTASALLNKLTGFQLLSQEIGPIQQLAMQIPFSLHNRATDLSIQWSGRRTEKGQIDSSHCRILFYLNMSKLDETIVDLHIQSRVVNITIINKHEWIETLAPPYIQQLKEQLNNQNYKLSSIRFLKEKKMANEPKTAVIHEISSNGVDMRI